MRKRKVRQTVIPQKIVKMAKFIQACDQDSNISGFLIVNKRQSGVNAAIRLARNNN